MTTPSTSRKATGHASLRTLLAQDGILTLPGIYDGISARIADRLGFPALYMTGYGTVASALALPDAGLASYTEMVDRVRYLAAAVQALLIADGDTGYGGLLNVERTVRGYEAAGAAAIQIEDQEFPKRCGHTEGRRVIPREDAKRKIEVALDTRADPDFLVIARTDARYAHGIDEALRRGEMFLAAGADILFVESPATPEEFRRIAETFKGVPLLANMVEGGRSPFLPAAELGRMGFKIALFPASGFLAAAASLSAVYEQIREKGTSSSAAVALHPFADMNRLMGFPGVDAFGEKWQPDAATES